MGYPILTALQTAKTTNVLDQYLIGLREDPTLLSANVSIIALEGERLQSASGTGSKLFTPTESDVANGLLRVLPGNIASGRLEESAHRLRVNIIIEVYTPGTHYADSWNLCETLHNASFSDEMNARMNPQPGLVGRPEMTIEGQNEITVGQGKYALVRRMVLSFSMRI